MRVSICEPSHVCTVCVRECVYQCVCVCVSVLFRCIWAENKLTPQSRVTYSSLWKPRM